MEEFRNKIKIFLAAMLIIVISQVFIASLTVSSFEKIYIKSYISVFNTVEKHFRENIEKALRFGKPLDKLYGIKEMMSAIRDENNKISDIFIYRPDGGILYSFTGTDMDIVPQSFRHDFTTENRITSYNVCYTKLLRDIAAIPAQTSESEAMSRDMKKRGFSFVGPTICYAFMQATGMVNDHLTGCFRRNNFV